MGENNSKFICIHGHFYQPPRENPWLEDVEHQESAYPYHDWNERITAECYGPNAYSRIVEPDGKIIDMVNNYSWISFNFGPTLLSWLEKSAPDVYESILWADKKSMERFSGHGSAMAQVYNHMIMPLASRRDKITQVRWGIRDFEHRFGREPEGMWLPETAVDKETLSILASEGIKFTVLSPYQAAKVRKIGEDTWVDVLGGKIDTRQSYLCKLPDDQEIVLFFYDGEVSREVSFGGLLSNGELFATRLLERFSDTNTTQLVNIATDGETYGHHKPFGDMALAYCIYYIRKNNAAKLTNYAEYLEISPPAYEVEILENTSWSCAHGVERWRSDCGCKIGVNPSWNQRWRAPLREALDWLRSVVDPLYEKEAAKLLKDPWAARNDYIEVILDRSDESIESFLRKHAVNPAMSDEEKIRCLKMLEMQRNAMLVYTSCGWFFDEISGLETTQILKYAARTIQLVDELFNASVKEKFKELLRKAPSNIKEFGDGEKVFERLVEPSIVSVQEIAANYAVTKMLPSSVENVKTFYSFEVEDITLERRVLGRSLLVIGNSAFKSRITLESVRMSYCAFWLGGFNIYAAVRQFLGEEKFEELRKKMVSAFDQYDIPTLIKLLETEFGGGVYPFTKLFKRQLDQVLDYILTDVDEKTHALYRHIFEEIHPYLKSIREIKVEAPRQFIVAAEVYLNQRIRSILQDDEIDLGELRSVVGEARDLAVSLDESLIGYLAAKRVEEKLGMLLSGEVETAELDFLTELITILKQAGVKIDLWRTQNMGYRIGVSLAKTGNVDEEKLRSYIRFCETIDILPPPELEEFRKDE